MTETRKGSPLRPRIDRIALRLAETELGGRLAAAVARLAPRLLPVRRVALTETVLAILHPQPGYDDHVVILPRRYVRDLCALVEHGDLTLLADLLAVAEHLDASRPPGGRWLTFSLGQRLHVPQLHGHLVSPSSAWWLEGDRKVETSAVPHGDAAALLDGIARALDAAGGCRKGEASVLVTGLRSETWRTVLSIAPSRGSR